MVIVVFDTDANPCLEVHCSVRRSHSITSLIWPFSGTIKVGLLNNPCLEDHCSVRRSHSITSLIWPFSGTIKVDLLNQVEDKNHHIKYLQLEDT